jgi:ABC-type branched-subunit amino acid transport system permease subunit
VALFLILWQSPCRPLPRSLIQDMFFILTMLVLAQFWNLLAGYGGLVSIGQQAFVGIGAYAMFGVVILMRVRSVPSILIAGVAALLLAIPTAFFAFRLQGAYFAIGTWVIAEVVRLSGGAVESRRRRHRHVAAAVGHPRHVAHRVDRNPV